MCMCLFFGDSCCYLRCVSVFCKFSEMPDFENTSVRGKEMWLSLLIWEMALSCTSCFGQCVGVESPLTCLPNTYSLTMAIIKALKKNDNLLLFHQLHMRNLYSFIYLILHFNYLFLFLFILKWHVECRTSTKVRAFYIKKIIKTRFTTFLTQLIAHVNLP